jgi:hypothetical protein
MALQALQPSGTCLARDLTLSGLRTIILLDILAYKSGAKQCQCLNSDALNVAIYLKNCLLIQMKK